MAAVIQFSWLHRRRKNPASNILGGSGLCWAQNWWSGLFRCVRVSSFAGERSLPPAATPCAAPLSPWETLPPQTPPPPRLRTVRRCRRTTRPPRIHAVPAPTNPPALRILGFVRSEPVAFLSDELVWTDRFVFRGAAPRVVNGTQVSASPATRDPAIDNALPGARRRARFHSLNVPLFHW